MRPNQRDQREITKSKVLLVEGQDEVNFFEAMLRKANKLDQVEIIEVGGKDKFRTEFPAIVNMTGFSQHVQSIGIVRDADENYMAAFQSVANVVERNGYTPPRDPNTFNSDGDVKVGIFIMPGNSENGMLEDLCLRTQADHPVMQCVEAFFQCIASKEIDQPKNIAKAKSQVFLAAMPDIAKSVGLGAKKNYWNLDHDCLFELKQFLAEL
ncbi:hypothetical protein QT234_16645 [Geobacillus stearothermophilus]|nr:hypothetical protein QT234_16645 [Geobacillus stearothermophilus]WJQ03583.1 hypothetical protein QT236_16650 [Geobacillus stearothermophilus]